MLSTYPLIAWGTADDLSAYTQSGTISATQNVTDPFGTANSAWTVNETDGAAVAYRYKQFTPAAGNGVVCVFAKQGTSSASWIGFYDTVAAAYRAGFPITWSAGVPTVGSAFAGSSLGPISVGSGWYLFLGVATGTVLGNLHQLRLGATDGVTASATGTTSFYVRNVVATDLWDNVTAWPEWRQGSTRVQGPSGAEDSWSIGPDYYIGGRVRWIPTTPASDPGCSGWDGLNESTGVNCGVAAMLQAGRDAQVLTVAKDRGTASTNQSAYLVDPMTGQPELERNAYRAFPIRLRSASPFTGV